MRESKNERGDSLAAREPDMVPIRKGKENGRREESERRREGKSRMGEGDIWL